MAVNPATASGAEVTLLRTSPKTEADVRRPGAHELVLTSDALTASSSTPVRSPERIASCPWSWTSS